MRSSISGCLDGLVHLAFGVALRLGFALVIALLAPRQPKLNLAPSVLIEINRQRYKGQALLGLDSPV